MKKVAFLLIMVFLSLISVIPKRAYPKGARYYFKQYYYFLVKVKMVRHGRKNSGGSTPVGKRAVERTWTVIAGRRDYAEGEAIKKGNRLGYHYVFPQWTRLGCKVYDKQEIDNGFAMVKQARIILSKLSGNWEGHRGWADGQSMDKVFSETLRQLEMIKLLDLEHFDLPHLKSGANWLNTGMYHLHRKVARYNDGFAEKIKNKSKKEVLLIIAEYVRNLCELSKDPYKYGQTYISKKRHYAKPKSWWPF
ncbi:hypothetical protein KAJ27_15955 [bacterium]|nr:hypothetical protein [bacterium]